MKRIRYSAAVQPIIGAWRSAWTPPDNRTPWEWCEDHVRVDNTSPFPGKWRSLTSPWVREVMEVAADRRVKFVAVRCSAQSSKTQTVLNLLLYCIAQDPGPAMYVMANSVDAEDFVRDRFRPSLIQCEPVQRLVLRETKNSYTFDSMPLYFVGAGSQGKLQGKPMKRLFLDEVRNWPAGALDTVTTRVTAFLQSGSQIFMISTPGNENDPVDAAFKQGDQRMYHFPCPKCGTLQQLRFKQLRWDTNEETKPDGQWSFDALRKTVRYECENEGCKHEISDTPSNRKAICRSGKFVATNHKAPAGHVSFAWNALLPWWIPWGTVIEEFLLARASARHGDIEPMRKVVTERFGEPWKDQLGVIEDYGFLEARKQDYKFGEQWEQWPEEVDRIMAADRQEAGGEHYWYVIRAIGRFGKSRLVTYGRCQSTQQLDQIREQYGVKRENACIDSGWKASEVYRFCASTGWRAFKGEPMAEYFTHIIQTGPKTTKHVRRVWDKTYVDPFIGQRQGHARKTLPLFRHVGNQTKDIFAELITGLIGEWSIPNGIGHDYLRQVTAERRVEHTDPKGRVTREWRRVQRDNHLFDCELIILVACIVKKHISQGNGPASDNVPPLVNGTDCDSRQTGQAAAVL